MSIKKVQQQTVERSRYAGPGPKYTPAAWERPADWLPMPEVLPTDQKIVMLVAIENGSDNTFVFQCHATAGPGTYTVDWGDGVIENIASGVNAQHSYTYTSISDTTISTRGYKQALIIVTPTGANNIAGFTITDRRPSNYPAGTFSQAILDVVMSLPNRTSGGYFGAAIVMSAIRMLERVVVKADALTNCGNAFQWCTALRVVDWTNNGNVSSLSMSFDNCHSLTEVSLNMPNLGTCTTVANMFANCGRLNKLPLFNTAAVQNWSSFAHSCFALQEFPSYNTAAATNMSNTFTNCYRLAGIPWLNTSNVTNFSGTFQHCVSLKSVPALNTTKATTFNSMFMGCLELELVPDFDTPALTNTGSMFNTCTSLKQAPRMNLSKVTTTAQMFYLCKTMVSTSPYDLSLCTTTAEMFRECHSLTDVGSLTTSTTALTTVNKMFQHCKQLETIPLFNTNAVTNWGEFVMSCNALKTLPEFNFTKATTTYTNYDGMFVECRALESLPASFANIGSAGTGLTDISGLFTYCYNLREVPLFNTSAVTSISVGIFNRGSFESCYNVRKLPAFNFNSVTAATNAFSSMYSLVDCDVYNLKVSHSYNNCPHLSKSVLEKIFTNLGTAATNQTINVSQTVGSDTAITRSCSTVIGSNIVTCSNTASLVDGMLITGAGINTARSVTFTASSNTVGLTSHGLNSGQRIAFPSIVTTTGITINRYYYVVNPTVDTFQVALTPGGAAAAMTGNGTGTVTYPTYISNIVPNTQFEISVAASSSNTNASYSLRKLDVSLATMKNWTVTG